MAIEQEGTAPAGALPPQSETSGPFADLGRSVPRHVGEEEAAAYCRSLGLSHITANSIKRYTERGDLRSALVANRRCYSDQMIYDWLTNTIR